MYLKKKTKTHLLMSYYKEIKVFYDFPQNLYLKNLTNHQKNKLINQFIEEC